MRHKTSIPKLHSIKWKDGVHAENVEFHPDRDRCGISADEILIAAIGKLHEVVIIGYEQDGYEYIAGNSATLKDAAYLFSRGQLTMLRYADEID